MRRRSACEKTSLMSPEKKVPVAVAGLVLLAVAFFAGTQWSRLVVTGSLYYSKLWQHQEGDGSSTSDSSNSNDSYLGGLLAHRFEEGSCLSRYQVVNYRHKSPFKPSPYLVQKLRDYENIHLRCGPYTHGYNQTLKLLAGDLNSKLSPHKSECKYLLFTPYSGLGNRIVSLTSSFLYALLTRRVLLIDRGKDFSKLFCEPFPNTSWLIPLDFPMKEFYFDSWHPLSYASLVKKNKGLPSFVYAHLVSDYSADDARFFFEEDQRALMEVPWLLVRSEVYFTPAFFLNEDFEPELAKMFPDTEAVFHHLSRYLFNPSNKVWGMILRYYEAYLEAGKETLGIQIRIFNHDISPFDIVSRQVMNCTMKEKLLPKVDVEDNQVVHGGWKIKNVLVTTLHSGYVDKIQTVYWDHPTAGGELVSVHQPSHEEEQKMDDEDHDMKAWAEMNLLSFSDVLVTSAWSTFGYVGQGLGGLKPWVLLRLKSPAMPEPSCIRDISMEPCFHAPPAYLLEKMGSERGKKAPYIRYCLDAEGGIKVYEQKPIK